jgi:hypothetical protein
MLQLLIPLALLASADTPTEPIDESIIELFLATGDPAIEEVCTSYSEVRGLIAQLGVDAETQMIFVELTDAYMVIQIESDELRLTPEARDAVTDWLHLECA